MVTDPMESKTKLAPLWSLDVPSLVSLSNQAFSDYYVPIHFNEPAWLAFLTAMGVSWDASQVVFDDEKPVGFILIARRGWNVRVATMGDLPEYRRCGFGSRMLSNAIAEGRQRGDRYLELEVIGANEVAVRLYEKTGIELIQDLYGFSRKAGGAGTSSPLEEVDVLTIAHLVAGAGAPNLPWQLSAETLASYGPPMKAYHLDGAHAVISDPSKPTIALMSLIVEPGKRGEGRARTLLSALVTEHEDKAFTIPALCPAVFEPLFKSTGFERSELSQHHMRLEL